MPENEFEKQVQQKMDELQFVPSGVIWQEVEKQISGRKKRRLLLIIWLPFLFLLMGGAAWIYHSGYGAESNKKNISIEKESPLAVKENNKQNDNKPLRRDLAAKKIKQIYTDTAAAVKKNTLRENHSVAAGGNNKTHAKTIVKNTNPGGNIILNVRNSKDGPVTKNEIDHKKNITTVNKKDRYNNDVSDNAITLKTAGKKISKNLPVEKLVAVDKDIAVKNISGSQKENIKTDKPVMEDGRDLGGAVVKDSATENNEPVVTKADKTDSSKKSNHTDSAVAITKNKPAGKKKKIEWGINLDGGVSDISQGVSGLFSPTPSYNMYALTNNSPSAGTSAASNPSDVKPGFAFATGVFFSKEIRKNFKLLAALNYHYYSTSLQTGSKIDSNTAQVQYRTGNSVDYTNQFHFIELSVTAQKQLGSASRFSINGGIAFSMLAGSNALQYDVQKNIYFVDNSLINKTQGGLLAGFHYRLLQEKITLEIGPQLNYTLSNIFKKELYGSRHLFFAGLGTKISFKKNKQ